jgi:hypothetical protein
MAADNMGYFPHPARGRFNRDAGISKAAGKVKALSSPSPIGWERVAAGRVRV